MSGTPLSRSIAVSSIIFVILAIVFWAMNGWTASAGFITTLGALFVLPTAIASVVVIDAFINKKWQKQFTTMPISPGESATKQPAEAKKIVKKKTIYAKWIFIFLGIFIFSALLGILPSLPANQSWGIDASVTLFAALVALGSFTVLLAFLVLWISAKRDN